MDKHCITRALNAAVRLPQAWRVGVNIHASTLSRSRDIGPWLTEVASASGIDPSRLTVEIVEHAPIFNRPSFFQSLESLRQAGMRISLDDIGQGNSNYQMIIDAHPDSFKIDRYFVAGCQCDPNRRAVINSVKKLADEMGANIIADGVEEREELDTLRSLGIELFQGYYLCIPRSVEQLIEMNADSSPGNFPWCGLVPEAAL